MQANVGGDPIFSDNLFKFGNKDGARTDARLQHPLAVCTLSESSVIVADSYNHQLKVSLLLHEEVDLKFHRRSADCPSLGTGHVDPS